MKTILLLGFLVAYTLARPQNEENAVEKEINEKAEEAYRHAYHNDKVVRPAKNVGELSGKNMETVKDGFKDRNLEAAVEMDGDYKGYIDALNHAGQLVAENEDYKPEEPVKPKAGETLQETVERKKEADAAKRMGAPTVVNP